MKKYFVYIHTCPNGKKYVGVTTALKPEFRWREGRGYCRNKHFYSAILKYGWSSITHEVFEVDSKEEMYYAEKYLIAYYHTTESKYGYNHSSGGEGGSLGCTRSEETRKKMSQAKKGKPGKPRSEETKKRISEANKGQIRSEESRQRIAENNRRKAKDPEYRRKISEAKKGKPLSEEAKKHMAEAAKNRPKIKISLPDGTIIEISKQNLVKNFINKGKEFEYVS